MNQPINSASDTIVAIATPPGAGGVGIVRLSGTSAREVGEKITGKALAPRCLDLTNFCDGQGMALDQGLATCFAAPASYTGEDVVELQAHGSPVVLSMLLDRCLELGARLAEPGEFSQRAFLNGKLDLVQAEAVADLIASGTRGAARAAMRSLQGAFSLQVQALDTGVRSLRAELEASIDFADEAEAFIDDESVRKHLRRLQGELEALLEEADRGARLQQRPKLVLCGAPNVGKSSLLNRLTGHERAIVSDQPGTTRDTLNEPILLAGLQVDLVDTAGLRPSAESIEAEGVRRARQAIAGADLRIDLWDASRPETRGVWPPPEDGQGVIEVMTKRDLVTEAQDFGCLAVSAKEGTGLQRLRETLEEALGTNQGEPAFLARTRHLEALRRAQEHMHQAIAEQEVGGAQELVAEALRVAHLALGEIVGITTSEDLLSDIFKHFCLGK